jgi:hypothetical protein
MRQRYRRISMWLRSCVLVVLVTLAGPGCGSDTDTVVSPWNLTEEPSGRQLSLLVRVGSGSCNEFDDVEVVESESTVSVDAKVDYYTGEDDCTADDSFVETTVELERPLGDRSLEGCRPTVGPLSDPIDAPPLGADVDCRRTLGR